MWYVLKWYPVPLLLLLYIIIIIIYIYFIKLLKILSERYMWKMKTKESFMLLLLYQLSTLRTCISISWEWNKLCNFTGLEEIIKKTCCRDIGRMLIPQIKTFWIKLVVKKFRTIWYTSIWKMGALRSILEAGGSALIVGQMDWIKADFLQKPFTWLLPSNKSTFSPIRTPRQEVFIHTISSLGHCFHSITCTIWNRWGSEWRRFVMLKDNKQVADSK